MPELSGSRTAAKVERMHKPLRIAFWGAGFAKTHVKALRQLDGCEIVGVCTRQAESGRAFAESMGLTGIETFTDFGTMLDRTAPDVAYLCVPPYAHSGEAEAAAARGIHLYLEKPVALTPSHVRRIAEAVEKAGVKAQVGHHMRFGTAVRRLKQMTDEGVAGRPCQFLGRWWCNMAGGAWWRDRERSGGQVVEQVIHIYDMAHHLFGPVREVSGRLVRLVHEEAGYTIEDNSAGTLVFENGALGIISGSNTAAPQRFHGDFRANWARLTADVSGDPDWETPNQARFFHHDRENPGEPEVHHQPSNPYLEASRNLFAAIRGEEALLSPVDQAVHTTAIVNAVVASSEQNGRPVLLASESASL